MMIAVLLQLMGATLLAIGLILKRVFVMWF